MSINWDIRYREHFSCFMYVVSKLISGALLGAVFGFFVGVMLGLVLSTSPTAIWSASEYSVSTRLGVVIWSTILSTALGGAGGSLLAYRYGYRSRDGGSAA